jgi:xanthine dehydrogenase YagS FAD-binding subunit
MNQFGYQRAGDVAEAVRISQGAKDTKYLGGGTNLVDLMREGIAAPRLLVDVTGISRDVKARDDGSIIIGAGATNTAVASDRSIRARFPALSRAILAGASGQIRNMATVGGNLLQRTRCLYFYDEAAHCNKRTPGSGCDAIAGFNRIHAILGASNACIATHPSDMCVALAALDAIVHIESANGARQMAFTDLHRLPGEHPEIDTELQEGELITAVELPALSFAHGSTYRKVRDRSSYAFALVSVAAALDIEDGTVRDVRLALGGVAHKPWRASAAEAALIGQPAVEASFRRAAEVELAKAQVFSGNAFKPELATRLITAVLTELAENNA